MARKRQKRSLLNPADSTADSAPADADEVRDDPMDVDDLDQDVTVDAPAGSAPPVAAIPPPSPDPATSDESHPDGPDTDAPDAPNNEAPDAPDAGDVDGSVGADPDAADTLNEPFEVPEEPTQNLSRAAQAALSGSMDISGLANASSKDDGASDPEDEPTEEMTGLIAELFRPRPVPVAVYWQMVFAYVGATGLTCLLILSPYLLAVSPRLAASSVPTQPEPAPVRIVEVPRPVPVPVPAPEPPEVDADDADDADDAASDVDVSSEAFVEPADVRPRPAPVQRPAPRPDPQPEPQPADDAAPDEDDPGAPQPDPPAPEPEPPSATAVVPEAAQALDGPTSGSIGLRSLDLTFAFGTDEALNVEVVLAGELPMRGEGNYTLQEDRAAFAVVTSDGSSWTGTADGEGSTGTVTYDDGKTRRFRTKR